MRFDVKPAEAVDYFKRKRIVTKPTFNKLEREAKAAAFYVSGIYREDVLTAFKTEIEDALEGGQSQQHVIKQFKDILAGASHKELGDFHLENVFRSNMQTAYGVGQRKALEEVSDDLPYWELVAVGDDRTRPKHLALSGSVYPANHEFWDTHYPPYDFMCRCTVRALSSVPKDYKHSRPNGETKIIYDDKGLPAKAEWKTQVLDLKVNKFAGVPKIANLEKALTDAAKAAKDSRLLNHQNIPQIIVDKARKIRRNPKETMTGWDKNGNNVGQFTGSEDEVYYPEDIEPLLEDGFDIHNHPPENGIFFESPSDTDFVSMVELKLKARYVVTRNYLYQVRVPKNGWQKTSVDDFYKSFQKNRAKIAVGLQTRIDNGLLTVKQAKDLERHLIWKEISKDLKFKYKRFKVTEL